MKRTRILLTLFLVTALFSKKTLATTTEILPESSHYQGRCYFTEPFETGGGIAGRIDFAVYDTQGPNGDELFAGGFPTAPGQGRYIYVYQIFSATISTGALDFFGILGLNENSFGTPLNDNIGSINDSPEDPSEQGVAPTLSQITLTTLYEPPMVAAWHFDNGFLTAGRHSFFLVMRSSQDWVRGEYTFDKSYLTTLVAPGYPNPEPATIILFGIGCSVILTGRK
ncbi:MAG TPA: PEP-CTERM sorting domain-containing protein, partial [Sedimentisphaerales bacterium]|nr:PEP-CTERM sorting domain-containing protein [Sedimentisphaerales bacterium]